MCPSSDSRGFVSRARQPNTLIIMLYSLDNHPRFCGLLRATEYRTNTCTDSVAKITLVAQVRGQMCTRIGLPATTYVCNLTRNASQKGSWRFFVWESFLKALWIENRGFPHPIPSCLPRVPPRLPPVLLSSWGRDIWHEGTLGVDLSEALLDGVGKTTHFFVPLLPWASRSGLEMVRELQLVLGSR